jgi:hypothetical protein
MSRIVFAGVLALAFTAPISAQDRRGRPGVGGGARSSASPPSAFPPIAPNPPMAGFPPSAGLPRGSMKPGTLPPLRPGHPIFGIWPGYGIWAPYSYPIEVPVPVPVFVPPGQPELQVELSGEAPATLVLQFPAPAEVWVSGKKLDGGPRTEWSITSPAVPIGTEHPFDVKARWSSNGRTFEYQKTVPVESGSRSRSLVLSGQESKQ